MTVYISVRYTTTVIKFWDWRLESRHPQESECLTRCRVTRRTLKQIHTLPQNSRRWPLRTSANVGIAAGSTAETCWQEGPVLLLLSQSWPLRPNEIYNHVGVLSCGERDKNRMVRGQVSTEDVTKRWPVALQVPLGQGQSDVQGSCCVTTANSSPYAKAQDAYDELNRINDQRSPCSVFFFQLHLLGWIPCEQFHFNKRKPLPIQHHPVFWPVLSRFFFSVVALLVFSRWRIVASVTDCTENTMFNLQLWSGWETSDHRQHIRSPQIIMRSTRWSCVRMRSTLCWVTRDMFWSSVRIL